MRRTLSTFVGVALLMGLVAPGVWAGATDYESAQAIAVPSILAFRNTSGSSMSSGTAVVLNFGASDVVTGAAKGAASSLGLDITTTTVPSNRAFVGVTVDDSCANNTLCRVITKGPAMANFACNAANLTDVNQPVGTSSVAGQLGSGTKAGILLSMSTEGTSGTSNNGCRRWVWVDSSSNNP